MQRMRLLVIVSAVICVSLTGLSCSRMATRKSHGDMSHKGPPAHAPAHGYRHKHQRDGVELVFNADRGVYVVVGFPGYYHFDGHYYRQSETRWETSIRISGDWQRIDAAELPAGLQDRGAAKKSPGKGHGHGSQKKTND